MSWTGCRSWSASAMTGCCTGTRRRGSRQPARPRIHGAREGGRFECKDRATWGAPDRELSLDDDRYGHVSVKSWGGLHPKLFCRGRFAGFKTPPVIRCHLIRVTVTRLPNGRKAPRPLWLWWAGPGVPDLDLIWRAYLHRFRYRAHLAVRQDPARLGQSPPPPPGAGLPLDLADHLPPSPSSASPAPSPKTTASAGNAAARRESSAPAGSAGISLASAALAGTPARPPKPSRSGPGRPKGRASTPATRYPVLKKAA